VRLSRLVCGVTLASCLLGSGIAAAQPTQPDAQDTTPVIEGAPRWEVEVFGGLSLDRDPSGGTPTIPATSSMIQGLASLSTFMFGSGTALFNQLRPATPITPLDAILGGEAITRGQSYAAGVRVYRGINDRFGIEFGGEYLGGQRTFRATTLSALESTRASFVNALGAVLPSSTVGATTTISDRQDATRMLATGALVIKLKTSGPTIPYIVAGGGVMFNNGSFPGATVTGTYQVGSPSALYGTDSVNVSYTEDDHATIYLAGAGIKQQVSKRFGIRADARVHVFKTSLINVVDVTPAQQLSTVGAPPPIISIGTLQFSAIGPLNGGTYSSAPTFTAGGLQAQISITAGLFYRF
jgi:hypothetical protein